ncbi:WhiB family transcriptional regulator [Williamsia serinedens]|uniref:Transcription factor WhiB n=1 Tax=Williamsia serinedens TaxID=391736 RepID=A0ABT1H7H2_9NOCA|nr:WhiB family transcriptional regulator [Williamsia serinedens]MCP2162687.1 Transcription factor WhiB [Williamsia serinedens]
MSDPVFSLPRPENWKTRGACVGQWQEFDAEESKRSKDHRTQLRLCATCPVLQECRIDTVRTRPNGGIRAGEVLGVRSERKFQRIAEAAGIDYVPPAAQSELQPCGTYAAYQRHMRRKEKVCDECRRAMVQKSQSRRRAS